MTESNKDTSTSSTKPMFLGVILGAFLTAGTTLGVQYLTQRYTVQNRILEESLVAYSDVFKTVAETKLAYEENLGQIAKVKLRLDGKELTEPQAKEEFFKYYDVLEKQHREFYRLFYFSYLLDEAVLDNLNHLYSLMSRAMNPAEFLNKKNFDDLVESFNTTLSSIAWALNTHAVGTKIIIPNPNTLIKQEAFPNL